MERFYSLVISLSRVILCLGICMSSTAADPIMAFDNFIVDPATRWEFITDQVMGGVSTGKLEFKTEAKNNFARMTGNVNLDNKGGFIQFRRTVNKPFDDRFLGLEVSLRGNGEIYFIHLRTSGTFLPWQYYQASFESKNKWSIVKIPFSEFRKSGWILSDRIKPKNIESIGIVAFGKKHTVKLDVRAISLY
jgi:hypothetical protein